MGSADETKQPAGGGWFFRTVFVALILLCALSLGRGYQTANTYGSVDFHYSGIKLMVHGINPYAHFLSGHHEAFILCQSPTYLPLLYVVLAPFGFLEFDTARAIWAGINIAIVVSLAGWVIHRARGQSHAAWVAVLSLLFLASTPVRNTITNGQHGPIILASILLSYTFRQRPMIGGAFLALAMSKYTFGFPLLFFFLFRRQLTLVLWSGLFTLLGYVVLWILTATTPGISPILDPVRVGTLATGFGFADLMSLLRRGSMAPLLAGCAGLGATAAFAWYAARRAADGGRQLDWMAFCVPVYASLYLLFHWMYDHLLVLLLIHFAREIWARSRPASIGFLTVFLYTGFFEKIPYNYVPGWIEGRAIVMVSVLVMLAGLWASWRLARGEKPVRTST